MQDKELSQWFDINVQKPWEPGVYEVSSSRSWNPLTYSSYWCGEKFHGGWGCPNEAYENRDHPGDGCGAEWRGLANNPKAKPKTKGNRKVTRYVVRSYDKQKVFASFANVDNARLYAEGINEPVRITKIRFRTPEA